jgi:hypothetical protein
MIESMYATKALAVVNELTSDGTKACASLGASRQLPERLNDSVTAVWLTKHESGSTGRIPSSRRRTWAA